MRKPPGAIWTEAFAAVIFMLLGAQEASPHRAAGVGDPVLQAKARLSLAPFDLAIALIPDLAIPAARENLGLGTGQLSAGVLLAISRECAKTPRLHVNVGFAAVGSTADGDLQGQLFIGLAGETSIPGLAKEQLQFVAEVFGPTAEQEGGPGDIQGPLGDVLLHWAGFDIGRCHRAQLYGKSAGGMLRHAMPHVDLRCSLDAPQSVTAES